MPSLFWLQFHRQLRGPKFSVPVSGEIVLCFTCVISVNSCNLSAWQKALQWSVSCGGSENAGVGVSGESMQPGKYRTLT